MLTLSDASPQFGILQVLNIVKAEVHSSFNTTTVWEQHPSLRSLHKDATDANTTGCKGRVRTGDQLHPVLCPCQLEQDIVLSFANLEGVQSMMQSQRLHHGIVSV